MELKLSAQLIVTVCLFFGAVSAGFACALFAGAVERCSNNRTAVAGYAVGIACSAIFFVFFLVAAGTGLWEWTGWRH